MSESPLQMTFDPLTIKHLGLRMYATLPPALAELISNAYDADAGTVTISLIESNGKPKQIKVADDGIGMSLDELNKKFLVIGRDRRDGGEERSPKFNRLPTGKKGLGKLALFGLANSIVITTRQGGKLNQFEMNWDDLSKARGAYHPKVIKQDQSTELADGTEILLTDLKRKTPFETEDLANSLSRIFLIDKNFNLTLINPVGVALLIDNKRKYHTFNREFEWDVKSPELVPAVSEYVGKLDGELITALTPITPSSGLRGITLYSRGKLVNAPEFFSSSTSSHFYQYLTGWISVDFIDLLSEDVISTNRQSIDWEHPEMEKLRKFLSGIVSTVNLSWRVKRKNQKEKELKNFTGIDTVEWLGTLPEGVKGPAEQILSTLGGEDALAKFTPVIKALHEIIPEYPELHWRHLHTSFRDRIRQYYVNKQYGEAGSEGVKIYLELLRNLSNVGLDGTKLIGKVFPFEFDANANILKRPPIVQLNDLASESKRNIQEGQDAMSRGVVTGFRNPTAHDPIDVLVPGTFSELDCLNILSLLSYLVGKLDGATINLPK